VTADGLASLQAEHASLIGQRPEVVARIKAAKELGDLKENADYTAAREEQGFLEGRIQAIEAQLRVIVVAEAPAGGTRVVHGSRVRVETDGEEVELRIVGATESNPGAGRISAASPVGKALLGRSVGDDAVVSTPGGEVRYRVLAID
jgi:transcription elongation factor GreA